MISTTLFFSLRATPGGELDLWEEMAGHQGTGRVTRRPADFINQPYWAGHRVHQQPLFDFAKQLFEEYRIRREGYSCGTLNFSSPRHEDFRRRMVELQEIVRFEMGALQFQLSDDTTTPSEWFILNPQSDTYSVNEMAGCVSTCRADRMPKAQTACVTIKFRRPSEMSSKDTGSLE